MTQAQIFEHDEPNTGSECDTVKNCLRRFIKGGMDILSISVICVAAICVILPETVTYFIGFAVAMAVILPIYFRETLINSLNSIQKFRRQVPDVTTLLKFRHLLEEHHLGEKIFDAINGLLETHGCMTDIPPGILQSDRSNLTL